MSVEAQSQADWFSPLATQQDVARKELPRTTSYVSLAATEQSAAGSLTGSARQSRRITRANFDEALRNRTITKFLYGKVSANGWFEINPPSKPKPLGVLVRQSNGGYVTEPQDLSPLLVQAVDKLKPKAALTISTQSTEALFDVIQDEDTEIMLGNSQLQIIASLQDIEQPQPGNLQHAALLKFERILLVWSHDVDQVLVHAAELEEKLLELIWGTNPSSPPTAKPKLFSMDSAMSIGNLTEKMKKGFGTPEIIEVEDLEQQQPAKESLERPLNRNGAYIMSISIFFLVFSIFGYTTSHLVVEWLYDGDTKRFYYIATEPLIMIVALFFSLSLATYVFQIFGPITGLKKNSRFFSAQKPNLGQAFAEGFSLPPVTIQMAVYKESLELVVMPTVKSLQAAVRHYRAQGGRANIFITDDGMGYLLHNDPEAAKARIEYYAANDIGWAARPMNGENGYFRTGRFKKASNSNFCMNFSNKVERTLRRLVQEKTQVNAAPIYIDAAVEKELYEQALAEELAKDSRAKAGGNIRLGEVILMVDSDTRVPEDCLIYGAAEMFLNPEVAIVQHHTSVFQVSHDFFENGASYFAKMCYAQIRFNAASGEYSPFVGHNAFVRWSAIQDVGMDAADPNDNGIMYWSEYHISEDFNMSIRLQAAGWVTRLAAYHGEEFKEMVSLTIYDEISRWERYSYGDSELIFNPIWRWYRGPFTKLFRQFLFCDMHLSSKLSIISYMASYYAIGSGFFYTIANYILVGLYPDLLDKFYMQSWNIFLSVVLVYWILGNTALAVMRYRVGERNLISSLWENFRWQPMYCFFFYGLSFHVNKALLAHIVGYEMTWEMTKKEVENSNFFKEIPKIIKEFMYMYLIMIPMAGGMIYMAFFAPLAWRITEPVATVPMALMIICHCSLPFVLNPYIITAVDEYKQDDANQVAKTI